MTDTVRPVDQPAPQSTAAEPEPHRPPPESGDGSARRRPRRRTYVLVVLLTVAAFAGSALGYSALQPTLYGAEAELLLTARPELSDTAADRAMVTQVMIVESPSVLDAVADRTGIGLTRLREAVDVEMVGRSNILRITVANRNPARAVEIAGLVTEEYFRTANAATTNAATAEPGTANGATADSAPVRATLLTPARRLEKPLQPRPLRTLAAGVLFGFLAAAAAVIMLWRPWRLLRPAPYWT